MPYLLYVSQYWVQSGCSSLTHAISLVFSDRWDWTYSPPLVGQLSQLGHQLVGAAGREAGRDNGLDVLKMAAVQPAQRLADGFLRRLLQLAGQTVPVHVHLAHIAGDTGALQLVHEHQRGVGVQRGKHAHAGGAVGDQIGGQTAVDPPGVVRVGKPRLGGECVGIQPVQQRQIHAHAQHGILGRVKMHVRKGLHDEPVAEVPHLGVCQLLRQLSVQAGDHTVLQHKAAVLQNVQPPHLRRMDDVAAQNLCHIGSLLQAK